eukprot:m.450631 g.450631  ORF g.450631 m.450631 type:complete len:447 (+) comp21514_c0_seq4:533-1873(+)
MTSRAPRKRFKRKKQPSGTVREQTPWMICDTTDEVSNAPRCVVSGGSEDTSVPFFSGSHGDSKKHGKRVQGQLHVHGTKQNKKRREPSGISERQSSTSEVSVTKRKKKRAKKSLEVSDPVLADQCTNANENCNADPEEPLEGIFQDDKLFLKGQDTLAIYSSVRDDHGNLVRIGKWTKELGIVLDPQQEPERGNIDDCLPCIKNTIQYPFRADSDDHCETPSNAYAHISPLLKIMCGLTGKSKENLSIWDPYFCAGSVKKHLAELGFKQCRNVCEDFYQIIQDDRIPEHDIIVTNPPFSEDHIPKFLDFAIRNSKGHRARPWCMLAPNWVYTKDYYSDLLKDCPTSTIFVVPDKRYRFTPPPGAREKKSSDTHKRTSPFPCLWYCGGFSNTVGVQLMGMHIQDVSVSRHTTQLPLHILADYDPRRKKLRNAMKSKKWKSKKRSDHH